MRTFGALLLCGATLALASCVVVDLHGDRAGLDAAIGDAQTEIAVHQANIEAAPSMTAARGELDRHRAQMGADVQHIRGHLDNFDWCGSWTMGSAWNAIDDAAARLDGYMIEAGGAPTVDDLRAATHDYAADMAGLIREVERRVDAADCW